MRVDLVEHAQGCPGAVLEMLRCGSRMRRLVAQLLLLTTMLLITKEIKGESSALLRCARMKNVVDGDVDIKHEASPLMNCFCLTDQNNDGWR